MRRALSSRGVTGWLQEISASLLSPSTSQIIPSVSWRQGWNRIGDQNNAGGLGKDTDRGIMAGNGVSQLAWPALVFTAACAPSLGK